MFAVAAPAVAATITADRAFEIVADTISTVENANTSDLMVFQLRQAPSILVLDYPTLEQQGRTFNRMVALIERSATARNRVLSDAELEEAIRAAGRRTATFASGNDFRISEIAYFFSLAESGNIALNADEIGLRNYVLKKAMMTRTSFGFSPNGMDRVILSLPQEQPRNGPDRVLITHVTRNAILRHEISHGEFYSNDDYAEYCRRFWREALSDEERAAFRAFLAHLGYDTGNEELMINEGQAYLMHTPDPRLFSAAQVRLPQQRIDALRARFWAGPPPSALFQYERSLAVRSSGPPKPAAVSAPATPPNR